MDIEPAEKPETVLWIDPPIRKAGSERLTRPGGRVF